MAGMWSEVEQVKCENRHELVLTGADINEKIQAKGLDENIFKLSWINFLEISKTGLTAVSPSLSKLSNLTDLVLHGNKLQSVPDTIGQLSKIKLLDLSHNELSSLPDEINNLSKLHTFNLSVNKLKELPDFSKLAQLHILDISHNEIGSLPAGIADGKLELLAQVLANNNQLEEFPATTCDLQSLKILDVSDNKLTVIPAEIAECQKLKEFRYSGNKLKDRRFNRMWEECSVRALLNYQRTILEKERKAAGVGGKGKKKKGKKGKKDDDEEEVQKNNIDVVHFGELGVQVSITENVMPVRQYIVCCIVKHLNMNRTKNMLRRFFTFQTKLHDTVCQKRQAATIATHDMKNIATPVTYDAKAPAEMKLTPLGKMKETTAEKLMEKLRKEADDFRKEKKRSTTSGIHQYLDLLNDQALYPCMIDGKANIISFPPITNCDLTKISRESHDILVEVTSATSLAVCKQVMDELLQGLLEMGIGCADEVAAGAAGGLEGDVDRYTSGQVLVVEQVRVVDSTGALKVVYPSRVDLQGEAYTVQRGSEQ